MKLFAKRALVDGTWLDHVEIVVDKDGVITQVSAGASATGDHHYLGGTVLPGMCNVHSHAFQRAFAGLSEYRTGDRDSFWTWRELMYRFLEKLTPDDCHVIARRLFSEMLLSGYTSVGEFHYLHHGPGGAPYQPVTEMADAVIRAAHETGIDICLLPVLYERGGFDNRPLAGGQLRFQNSTDTFVELVNQLVSGWSHHPHIKFGIAPHSLRAAAVESIRRAIDQIDGIIPGCPIHIHVAEQTAEVDECMAATNRRPIELLFESFSVDDRWCLIHATHATDPELALIATSGAVVGICPSTEANLGDGIFPTESYLQQNGRLAIGSDSHVTVDPWSELRLMEYAQRLTLRHRAILCDGRKSNGRTLFDWTSSGGQRATQFHAAAISVGNRANLIEIDTTGISHLADDRVLDGLIFASRDTKVVSTAVIGAKLISMGNLKAQIADEQFTRAVAELLKS